MVAPLSGVGCLGVRPNGEHVAKQLLCRAAGDCHGELNERGNKARSNTTLILACTPCIGGIACIT